MKIDTQTIDNLVHQHKIFCMASGEMDGEFKFYFYSKYVHIIYKKAKFFN